MAFSAPTKPSYAVALGAALLIGAWSFRQRRRRKDESSDSSGTSEAKRNVPSQQQTPIRVLVTGFNDWRDLEAPSDIWRSQENPSSRLLLGSASACPSLHRQGALVTALERRIDLSGVDFCFSTLPTLWQTSNSVDYGFFDVVVHLGLGVYDSHHEILLESGAYNARAGPDALGHPPPHSKLAPGHAEVLSAPPPLAAVVGAAEAQLAQVLPSGFTLRVAPARAQNTYICNETHWRALEAAHACAVHQPGGSADLSTPSRNSQDEEVFVDSNSKRNTNAGGGRLRGAFFVHVPYPAVENEYGPLADALAEVVAYLVKGTTKQGGPAVNERPW